MQTITNVAEMREYSRQVKKEGKKTGLVPTMGYLHEGHLSLVRAAREDSDVVAVSIFVNPTQFGPGEDLMRYPRDIERDRSLLEVEGADVIFAPTSAEMYPLGYATDVEVTGELTEVLCGASRPGHFKGVATVVAKLFNIVEPQTAYFGQKDAQQSLVVKRMAADLNIPVDIRVLPIVREKDGLAMSSRNGYLSEKGRAQALGLYEALRTAKDMAAKGETSSGKIRGKMRDIIEKGKDVRVDYAEIADPGTLEILDEIKGPALALVAAFVEGTRIIDNMMINT